MTHRYVSETAGTVRILKSKVMLEGIGPVEVSTVDLSSHGILRITGYETCLFWGTESRVVQSYSTWAGAVRGHVKWRKPETVARALHMMYVDRNRITH